VQDVRFPSLSKHFDGARLAINEVRGYRDMVLARSAETYLMAAEAKFVWQILDKVLMTQRFLISML
jgi:hypothetical protein